MEKELYLRAQYQPCCDLQPKSGCQPTSDSRKGWKLGKSVRIHTKQ